MHQSINKNLENSAFPWEMELTEEQKRQIEHNRQLALQRLETRKRAEEQSNSHPIIQPKKLARERLKFQLATSSTFMVVGGNHLWDLFRGIEGSRYDGEEKNWHFPLTKYKELISQFGQEDRPNHSDEIPENILEMLHHRPSKTFDLAYLDAPIRQTLYPFQREGIQMALGRGGRIILADDMGLGKSIQAISIALYYRIEWPLLVVTPASMVT
jgi:SNF2 family DNA or RNA helicase